MTQACYNIKCVISVTQERKIIYNSQILHCNDFDFIYKEMRRNYQTFTFLVCKYHNRKGFTLHSHNFESFQIKMHIFWRFASSSTMNSFSSTKIWTSPPCLSDNREALDILHLWWLLESVAAASCTRVYHTVSLIVYNSSIANNAYFGQLWYRLYWVFFTDIFSSIRKDFVHFRYLRKRFCASWPLLLNFTRPEFHKLVIELLKMQKGVLN